MSLHASWLRQQLRMIYYWSLKELRLCQQAMCFNKFIITAGDLGHNLYAFTSVDFLTKDGATVALESPTKVMKVDFALGLKYLVPFSCGDFYVGLGVQPSRLFTHNEMTLPIDQSQWSCGGIAKVGTFFDLPRSFFADIFIDYSFVDFKSSIGLSEQFVTTAVNGCLFGIGFGYRFN